MNEQFITDLHKRWDEIQKEKAKKAATPAVKPAAGSNVTPRSSDAVRARAAEELKRSEKMVEAVKKALRDGAHKDAVVGEDKNRKGEDYVEKLKDLLEPLLRFGNVVVGESKTFRGWWCVLPPIGFPVSYSGPSAKERAIDHARMIQEYYE